MARARAKAKAAGPWLVDDLMVRGTIITVKRGEPAMTEIYFSHYCRLLAVAKAVETRDPLLIRLALEYHQKWDWRDDGEA